MSLSVHSAVQHLQQQQSFDLETRKHLNTLQNVIFYLTYILKVSGRWRTRKRKFSRQRNSILLMQTPSNIWGRLSEGTTAICQGSDTIPLFALRKTEPKRKTKNGIISKSILMIKVSALHGYSPLLNVLFGRKRHLI